uniref:capsid assembly scaffolding protein Gp46 family protein n=1 Tax=Geobacillus kaustophilus TaxID=1462 RepID=UPI000A52BAC2
AKREAEITRRELRATALETLAEKGLPKQLADILVYTDAETCQKSIESVEKVFRDAVEAAVNERLKGGEPPKGGGGGKGNAEIERIKKIFAQR